MPRRVRFGPDRPWRNLHLQAQAILREHLAMIRDSTRGSDLMVRHGDRPSTLGTRIPRLTLAVAAA